MSFRAERAKRKDEQRIRVAALAFFDILLKDEFECGQSISGDTTTGEAYALAKRAIEALPAPARKS